MQSHYQYNTKRFIQALLLFMYLTGLCQSLITQENSTYTIEERTVYLPKDHFRNYGTADHRFSLRYLIDDRYFDPVEGCILFFAGGYLDIWNYYNKSGFVSHTLPKELKALVIFGEHRYFGTSLPENLTLPDNTNHRFPYLSIDQALMDYVLLIKHVRNNLKTQYGSDVSYPTFTFGSSYAGMLAAWLRMKYPASFQGALASSAPMIGHADVKIDPYIFNKQITLVYKKYDEQCPDILREGFKVLDRYSNQLDKYPLIQELFNTCTLPLDSRDIQKVIAKATLALTKMTVTNRPHESDFMAPLPKWPVKQACIRARDAIEDRNSDQEEEEGYLRALSAAYHTFQWRQCLDISPKEITEYSPFWDHFFCTQLGDSTLYSRNGVTDMFLPLPWNITEEIRKCQTNYNLTPNFDWVVDNFGGSDPDLDFAAYSNIIFSNGDLDPWTILGLTETPNEKLSIVLIKDGAHGLDLQLPMDIDLESVKEARKEEIRIIKKWINEYRAIKKKGNFDKPDYYKSEL